MYSAPDVLLRNKTGFPIQKSPDQSLFSSSPKLIAAYHVFHRLLTPRHPPFALNSLATKKITKSCWSFYCIDYVLNFITLNYQRTKNIDVDSHTMIIWKSKTPIQKNGGGERAWTDGLLRARQALSQLSYTPNELVISIGWKQLIESHNQRDGPGWSWTIDLTLIRRAL